MGETKFILKQLTRALVNPSSTEEESVCATVRWARRVLALPVMNS